MTDAESFSPGPQPVMEIHSNLSLSTVQVERRPNLQERFTRMDEIWLY